MNYNVFICDMNICVCVCVCVWCVVCVCVCVCMVCVWCVVCVCVQSRAAGVGGGRVSGDASSGRSDEGH